MMDSRLETFLTLCQTLHYRKTAEILHMTQPAVTQQIQYLERYYNCKLVCYNGKTLEVTPKGTLLYDYAISLRHNEKRLTQVMRSSSNVHLPLRLGATKTIGNYVINKKIERYLRQSDRNLTLSVDNTEQLLMRLEAGDLDLALVEGCFDKQKYEYRLYRQEPFVGICSSSHPFSNREVAIEELFNESLIIREQGSGTRDIFEEVLHEHGFSLNQFSRMICISNFPVIKDLIRSNLGISFAYRAVWQEDPSLSIFSLQNTPIVREFNYVYLKNSIFLSDFEDFWDS